MVLTGSRLCSKQWFRDTPPSTHGVQDWWAWKWTERGSAWRVIRGRFYRPGLEAPHSLSRNTQHNGHIDGLADSHGCRKREAVGWWEWAAPQGLSTQHRHQQYRAIVMSVYQGDDQIGDGGGKHDRSIVFHGRILSKPYFFSFSASTVALCWPCLRDWCNNSPSFINAGNTRNCLVRC